MTTSLNDVKKNYFTGRKVDFAVTVDHRVKIKDDEKGDQFLTIAREQKMLQNIKVIEIITCTCNDPQRFGNGTGRVVTQKTNWNYPDYSITKIGQNTEKSSRDFKWLAVTQAQVKDHQLTMIWKTHKK